MNARSWVFLSLLLHALVVAGLWPFSKKVKPSDVLEIELKPISSAGSLSATPAIPAGSHSLKSSLPRTETSRAKTHPSRSSKTDTASSTSKEQSLKKLLLNPYNSARPVDVVETGSDGTNAEASSAKLGRSGAWDEGGYTTNDDPSVAWGAGSGTFERIQDTVLMARFHEKVDHLLFYPGVLARRKMAGTVNSRVVINAAGDCDWQRTQIASANPYFRIYILQLLKKVCSENFKKYTKHREMTNVDMSFEFVIDEDMTTKDLIEKNQKVVGNVLLFYRHNRHSVAEWHLGPLTGVFPLPFVNLDFDWILENFDTYFNKIDPLEEYHSKSEDFIESY